MVLFKFIIGKFLKIIKIFNCKVLGLFCIYLSKSTLKERDWDPCYHAKYLEINSSTMWKDRYYWSFAHNLPPPVHTHTHTLNPPFSEGIRDRRGNVRKWILLSIAVCMWNIELNGDMFTVFRRKRCRVNAKCCRWYSCMSLENDVSDHSF